MGTPEYATEILSALVREKFQIVGVFTQSDKPVGRKQILTPPSVKIFATQNLKNTPLFQPENLRSSEIRETIRALKPDFIIVAAYGKILPPEILEICPCINLHASILPKFRGASPIQSAILESEKFSGVTAMKMAPGLDDGDILGFSFTEISNLKSGEVFEILAKIASNLTIKILRNYAKIAPLSQHDADKSHCKKIKKTNGEISFEDEITEILAKFHAFYDWPGIFLNNGTKLLEIEYFSNEQKNIGEISQITKNGFALGVRGGEIEILKLQEASKKPILAKDFINGKRLKVGDRIS